MRSMHAVQAGLARDRVIAATVLLWALALGGRLIQLHLTSGTEFERLAARQSIIREVVAARPGEIVDRHGHVFATSICVRSVYVVPRRIRTGWETARSLGEALGLDPDRLFEQIAAHPDRQFLWVQRLITDDEADRVRTLNLPADACGFRDEFRRFYPHGSIAAQLLAMRDIDGRGQ